MSAHTPGPWLIDFCDAGGFYVYVEPTVDMGATATIVSRGAWGHKAAESHANARLIAAAPELLAALHGLLFKAPDATGEAHDAIWDAARSAYAKATGEGA